MKPILILFLALSFLAGCSRNAVTSVPELGDRILTVDEYLAQPELRKKVIAVCHDDPGRMALTPNCINVRRADHIASMGDASKLHIDLSP